MFLRQFFRHTSTSTLMPPPQPFFTSRISGFVCRSCLSQLRKSHRPRIPWLVRSSTSSGPSRKKAPKGKIESATPFIKYFEEDSEGRRREIRDEEHAENAAILESLEERMRIMEEAGEDFGEEIKELEEEYAKYGTISLGDEQEGGLEEGEFRPEDLLKQSLQDFELSQGMKASLEEMKSQMANASQLGSLSQEERMKLRERLLKGIAGGTFVVFDQVLSLTFPAAPRTLPNPTPPSGQSSLVLNTMTDVSAEAKVSRSRYINADLFPEVYHRHIQSLNAIMLKAPKILPQGPKPLSDLRKQAWRSYLMCRKTFVSSPDNIPLRFWSMLWNILVDEQRMNQDRMAHINYLGADMLATGIPLNGSQMMLYIEACFLEGDRHIAFEMWKNAEASLGSEKNILRDYWRFGIWMLCEFGQVEGALQAAATFLDITKEAADLRVFVPIIEACLAAQGSLGKQRAWALYIRMKVNIGPEMTMEDYDSVIAIFLKANQPDLALGVFKDMMLTGEVPSGIEDSAALYKKATGFKDKLGMTTIDKSELKWENSRALATLPSKFNNKYFFGKWIKKLIGDGELDAAKKVLDLMHDRGICPDAKYMNGLIGALYRTKSVKNQTLADDMAWRMIAARLEFVEQRDLHNQLTYPLRPVEGEEKKGLRNLILTPNATIETFSILIQQYRQRQKQELLVDLFNTLKKAQIPPSTFFMNQMIMVDTKSHQSQWAWDTYTTLVKTHGVRPDFSTYNHLWNMMKKEVDPVYGSKQSRLFTTCRTLFLEMIRHVSDLKRKETMPRELYEHIILGFSLAGDQVGTALALRALQKLFNMYPTEDTVRTVVIQLSRFRMRSEVGKRPRRMGLNRATKNRIAQVTEVLAAFKDKRVEILSEQGIDFEQLHKQEKLEESLIMLSSLLRYVYLTKVSDLDPKLGALNEITKAAAEGMGVPNCDPWVESISLKRLG